MTGQRSIDEAHHCFKYEKVMQISVEPRERRHQKFSYWKKQLMSCNYYCKWDEKWFCPTGQVICAGKIISTDFKLRYHKM